MPTHPYPKKPRFDSEPPSAAPPRHKRAPARPEPQNDAREQIEWVLGLVRRTLRFYWIPTIAGALGVVACVVFLTAIWRPKYRSETVIFYQEGIRSVIGGNAGDSRNMGARMREILLARSNLERIIEEFKLFQDIVEKRGMVDAVERFREAVQFKIRSSDTFVISFEGTSPEEVQAVTARLAEALVEEDSRLRIEQAKVTRDFLDTEKKREEENLRRKEIDLAKFLAQHPEFALDTHGQAPGGAVRAQKSGELAQAAAGGGFSGDPVLNALERQVPRIRKRLEALATPGAPPPPPPLDPALVAAKSQADSEVASARRALQESQSRYTEQHPDVRAAQARLAAAEANQRRAQEAIAAAERAAPPPSPVSSKAEREELEAQLKKIEAEIAYQRAKVRQREGQAPAAAPAPAEAVQSMSPSASRIVALETEWTRLKRDVEESRERYEQLEANYFKAQIAASSQLSGFSAQLQVIDPAYKPSRPFTPGRSRYVAGIMGVALTLGATIALAFALLDDHLYNASDVARLAPVLAVVPRAERRRGRSKWRT